MPAPSTLRDIERFWEKTMKVDEPDGCWLWLGSQHERGYGLFAVKRKTNRAHRWLYTRLIGPLSEGVILHHRCEITRCVNPAHLIPMTQAEHAQASMNHFSHKTHCPQGHEYTEANTKLYQGRRYCRACRRARR